MGDRYSQWPRNKKPRILQDVYLPFNDLGEVKKAAMFIFIKYPEGQVSIIVLFDV
jgi:hypothetical protein